MAMLPSAVTLRPARSGDVRAMAAMSRDLIEAGLSWRYKPARVAGLSRDPDTMALVACCGDTIQGFAIMQFGDERAHLTLLCVRRAQQRSGIGRRLIEWLIASARVAGIASIHLELRADNESARAFYRALGFGDTIVVPDYYAAGIAARRMVRVLRQAGGDA